MHKRSMHSTSFTAIAVACLMLIGLPPAAAKESAPPSTTMARYVQVNVSCAPGGGYSWNASVSDFSANTTYSLYSQYTYFSKSGGFGGSFAWKYAGNIPTGRYGGGSSSTFYGNAGSNTERVEIRAKVGTTTGVGSDTC